MKESDIGLREHVIESLGLVHQGKEVSELVVILEGVWESAR